MHSRILLKDMPKWETSCNESVETISKRLKVNDMEVYSNNSTLGTLASPNTLATPASTDTPSKLVGGLIRLIGGKADERKAKEKVEDLVLDLMTKELSGLETTNANKNSIFTQYVQVQERKLPAAEEAIELRCVLRIRLDIVQFKKELGANTYKLRSPLIIQLV